MNLFDKVIAGEFRKTGATKKISVPGNDGSNYDVYAIPLKYLYYNDQNGRINTAYRQYQSENGVLAPEPGDPLKKRLSRNQVLFCQMAGSLTVIDVLLLFVCTNAKPILKNILKRLF
jgi:hypothetical protein